MPTSHSSGNNPLNQLFAGAAKTDITPPLGTFINGDFVTHYAQYIHDPLYARALVLKQGAALVALVVVDICVMPKEFVDDVKTAIVAETGIPFQNILVSSTHTHAAGSVASVYLSSADLLYTKKLPGLIVDAAVKAKQNLRPARTAFGSVNVPEHVRCRRYFMQEAYKPLNPVTGGEDRVKTNPFGKGHLIREASASTDPEVGFLAIQGTDGDWICLLANYSLHYVGDWENGTISADYFGVFAGQIQQKLNAKDDFVGMMCNGTSGNINIWDFHGTAAYPSQSFKKGELIGTEIAEKVFRSLKHLQWEENPDLAVMYEELRIPLRKPSPAEIEIAKKRVADSHYENLQIDDEGLRSIYAREQVLLNELPDELLFPVQAIRIGSGVIGGLGGEIFAETGLWLKANIPARYFTISLANGNCGYVPPAHEHRLGGYETWRSRTSKLKEDAEEMIRKKQLELANKLIEAMPVHK